MPVPLNTGPATTGASRPPASPRFARSGQMVRCLRSELLYSERVARDLLFDAIQVLVARTPEGLIVARLTREAAQLAREAGDRTGYAFANWSPAGKAVVHAMLQARALLGPDGSPVPLDVSAQAAVVGGLQPDFRDRTEAFLLEFLLRRLGDVTLRDHTALAHALFRTFDPHVSMHDLEDRVVVLLARLADRVTLVGDAYVVRTTGTASAGPTG